MDNGLLVLTLDSDLAPYWEITTTPGGATPQDMTGWSLQLVIRRSSDNALVLNTTAITIGNGNGTNSRATVDIDYDDMVGWPFGLLYYGTLWRTPAGSYAPLWTGPVRIERTAARP